jgi:hypothetical protein
MSQLRVGDKVRPLAKLTGQYQNEGYLEIGKVYEVEELSTLGTVRLSGVTRWWAEERFELVEPVSNETQLPGIPDGYRAVRWGVANLGDKYVSSFGVDKWTTDGQSAFKYLIVEKITPPEPPKLKTRSVVLNRYLVWEGDTHGTGRVIVAEEDYVTDNWQNLTLLGHSETIEVEV